MAAAPTSRSGEARDPLLRFEEGTGTAGVRRLLLDCSSSAGDRSTSTTGSDDDASNKSHNLNGGQLQNRSPILGTRNMISNKVPPAPAASASKEGGEMRYCWRFRSPKATRLVLMCMALLAVIANLVLQHHRTIIKLEEVRQQAAALIVDVIASSLSAASSVAVTAVDTHPTSSGSGSEGVDSPSELSHSSLTASSVQVNANLTKNLPDWLVKYMDWHRHAKPNLTEDNWDQHNPTPTTSPAPFSFTGAGPPPLEAFLVPPYGGLDWRVPDWLLPKLELGNESHWQDVPWDEDSLLADYRIKTYYRVVEFSFIFQLHRLVDQLEKHYRDCFRALFEPVPEIRRIVDTTQRDLGLVDQPYTSVHLRMKYTSIDRDEDNVWRALLCAAKIGNPTVPIFVASDSGEMAALATRIATERNLNRTVVARNDYHLYPSLHMDMGADFFNPRSDDWRNHNASEYYTVFSDLLLLGDASCVVAGTGSYGKWGSQLSRNVSCFGNYMTGEGC